MKKVLKIGGIILLVVYAAMAITLTLFLLKYNDYNITVINGKSLISLKSDYDDLKKGSLVVVKDNDISVGDKVFYYEANGSDVGVNLRSVKNINKINASESTYTLDNDKVITKDFIIGTKNNAKVYPVIGGILLLLESKWGFLGIVILPVAVCFIFEIYTLVKEFKPKKKRKKNEKK